MDQNSDLLDVQEVFSQLLTTNKLQPKIAQKLSLLQLSIFKNADQIDTSFFNELSELDCQALIKLNKNAKTQMFVQIVRELAQVLTSIELQKHNLTSGQTQILKSTIDIKTKTLGRWKSKKFTINIPDKTFEIPRKKGKKKSKPDRLIQLQFYSLNMMKNKDNRSRFCLQALQKGKGYYKSLVCGTSDATIINTVVDLLKRLCYFNDESLLLSIGNLPDQQNGPKNGVRQSEIILVQTSNQIISSQVNANGSRQSQSVIPGSHSIYTQEITNQKPSEQPYQNRNSQPIRFTQAISMQEDNERENTLEANQNPKEFPPNMATISQAAEVDTQNFVRNPLDQSQTKDINVKSTKQLPQKAIDESPMMEPSPFRTQKSDRFTDFVDRTEPLEVNEDVKEDKELDSQGDGQGVEEAYDHVPQLFQQLVDDGMLVDSYLDNNFTSFNTVYNVSNLEILRSTLNPLLFRSVFSLNSTDIDRVFQILAEIDFMKKWNGNINGDDSKFVGLIQSERSAIIYEKRKQYGMFYLPRDYVYLRNCFERYGKYYIVDKSIEHEDCPQQYRVIRGDINYQMIRIEKKPESKIMVSIESEITNGGFSSTEQDGHITLIYLQEIKNIAEFLKTYSEQPIIQSPLLTSLQNYKMRKNQKIIFQQLEAKSELQDYPAQTPGQFENQAQAKGLPLVVDEDPRVYFRRELSMKEQNDDLHSIQNQLSCIPDTGTYKAEGKFQEENQNEIQNLENLQNEEDEDDDEEIELGNQVEYVPIEVMTSTSQHISQQYKDLVMKQIQAVEHESYFSNCLVYKYMNEPFDVKPQFVNDSEGGHFFLKKDWQRDSKNGGLLFINPKKLEAQKRVLKFMFKKIGSNLLQGKSLLSISLPVDVFETRSNLERFAYAFIYAPKYLEDGARMSTPEEQMKMTITFGLSAILMYLSVEKPFNPILGETYQGFVDGCPVYVEQIRHHPPICAFQMYGRGYKLDGHIESVANMHANSVQGKNVGFMRVTYYNTGAIQSYLMVPGYFSGTTFGDKLFNLSGQGFCIDEVNHLIWEGNFNPAKSSFFGRKTTPQDFFSGGLYRVKNGAISKYKKEGYSKYNGLDLNKDVIQKLNETVGIWNEYLEIDGVQTWNLTMHPHVLSNHRNPLPSDSNYRLDILYWRLTDGKNSQRTKEILEGKQRNDKKLREKYGNHKK